MIQVITGDALQSLKTLPAESVQCCVTSPPYWGLRDYGHAGQLGLEKTPEEYVAKMVAVFWEVRRVLRGDGTCWINLGDSYCSIGHKKSHSGFGTTGLGGGRAQEHTPLRKENNASSCGAKHKDLVGIPWMVAFALRADGWYLRQDIIWSKPNPMPESVTDRCTKAHEYIFLLTKSARYHYDAEAIKEPASEQNWEKRKDQDCENQSSHPTAERNGIRSRPDKQRGHGRRHAGFNDRWDAMERAEQCSGERNKRDVWTVATAPYPDAHFATYPPALIKPCILAGTKPGDTVLDPFAGSGTTGMVALELGRKALLIELNADYVELIERRCDVTPGLALTSVGDGGHV